MFEQLTIVSVSLGLFPLLRRAFFSLFLIALLVGEFYYINIGDGVARIYHFLAVTVVLSLVKHLPAIIESRVFSALMIFVLINIFAVIFSDAPVRAMASFLSLSANIAIAIGTALILISGKISLVKFRKIILTVTLISICWGLLQIVFFRLLGVNFGLSPEQEFQIAWGFGPGFRTEANTFGKYMVFPVLFFLSDFIERKRNRNIGLISLIFLIGVMMNFTRSSLYGMGVSIVFVVFWYAKQGKIMLLTSKGIKISILI